MTRRRSGRYKGDVEGDSPVRNAGQKNMHFGSLRGIAREGEGFKEFRLAVEGSSLLMYDVRDKSDQSLWN